MHLKSSSALIACTCVAGLAVPAMAGNDVEFDVPANFEIQGKKILYDKTDDPQGNNLDEWWGRGNISVVTKSSEFESKMTLRIYPSDFGLTLQDTAGKAVKTDKLELYEAWAGSKNPNGVDVKIGRWRSDDRMGFFFGNYTDYNTKGYSQSTFFNAGPGVNGVEFSRGIGDYMRLRTAFLSEDPNLNKGSLRAKFQFQDLPSLEALKVQIGYRSNMFDWIHDNDAIIYQNISLGMTANVTKTWILFMETGLLGVDDRDYNMTTPVLGGTEFPIGRVGHRAFDKCVLEAEWDYERKKETKGSLMLQKKIGEHYVFTYGAYSAFDEASDIGMALRLKAIIN